eukprot:CAMPEP_0185843604 /NCGR_PEP_ID=MMETSP1354-20130828/31_1 /TAXON_ID=708628 /ORGANISM="Erythrolobus madagascarensis, Strain CCMP3276" /LENGTH=260 /DNA_ID=CAMNT_0028543121 /DNA_START=89 /DNA_END=871 /DNA_ORIENTATION=+
MTIQPTVVLKDTPPAAFFVSQATHMVLEMALLDCRFAVMTENAMMLQNEAKALARALDNYACIQRAGWYAVIDSHFNGSAQKNGLYEKSSQETTAREQFMESLARGRSFQEIGVLLGNWTELVYDFLKHENYVLRPFEDYLLPEISIQILANGGNDWEWFLSYLVVKLEKHHKFTELATFALQMQAAIKRCPTRLERGRILPAFCRSMTPATLGKIAAAGFQEDRPDPTSSRARSGRAFSRGNSLKSLSSRLSADKSVEI